MRVPFDAVTAKWSVRKTSIAWSILDAESQTSPPPMTPGGEDAEQLRYALPHWSFTGYYGMGWYCISLLHSSSMHCRAWPATIFQQDNARPHVARIVQRFFVNHQIELLPWPAHSPDLSPIENMWSMVAQRLIQITPPAATPDQLWQRVEASWSAAPQEHIQLINDVPFELLSFANPLDYAILGIRLDLVLNVRKRDLSPTALHAIALETINTRFPPEEWLHIYTDGSLLDFAQGAGIDSTSALQALSNYNENNCLSVQNCRELLGKIKGKIVFQWIPSHCGLWGNEKADFLAKKGTGILQNFRRDLTLHSAKLEIKRIFRESFRLTASRVARDKHWSTLCKKSHGIPSSPRAAAVAKFRLLTGHDCLCAHLFRFNLVTSPICVLCDTGQDMTAAHLDECSALNDLNCIVKRYWRARCLMT
ncbi:uncharacterized protein LOC103524116 [Trichonephila clavipes]|nr:uncharacterized protein LOC103524116 [Trichonephila clavipes]